MRKSLTALTTAILVPISVLTSSAHAGEPTVVAVLDTGINAHRDLGWSARNANQGRASGFILSGYDFISDAWTAADGNGWDPDPRDNGDGVTNAEAKQRDCNPRESSWHGLNVAGTIANLAPSVRILPARIMGRCGGNTADVAAAILWAAGEPVPNVPRNSNPARIINLSLSGKADRCPRPLQTAIDIANERGAIVVVAAGSTGTSTSESTPANCEGVLVVGSTDKNGSRSPTSNYGPEITLSTYGGNLAAEPTQGVWTTTNAGPYRPSKPSRGYFEGSSAAAARMSGALAELTRRHPTESNEKLIERLTRAAVPFAVGQCDKGANACGAGIVNIDALLEPTSG